MNNYTKRENLKNWIQENLLNKLDYEELETLLTLINDAMDETRNEMLDIFLY